MAANTVFKNIVDKGTRLRLRTPQNVHGNLFVIKSRAELDLQKSPLALKFYDSGLKKRNLSMGKQCLCNSLRIFIVIGQRLLTDSAYSCSNVVHSVLSLDKVFFF